MAQGDVYHLVFELGEWLDGRVWAEEDRLDVLRLVDLIHHVTGVSMFSCLSFTISSWGPSPITLHSVRFLCLKTQITGIES